MSNRQKTTGHNLVAFRKHWSAPVITGSLLAYVTVSILWFLVADLFISELPNQFNQLSYINLLPSGIFIIGSAWLWFYWLHVIFLPLLEENESLSETAESLNSVLEGSQLGYWDWNIQTNEVKRNAIWAEMLGYELNEIEFSVKQWNDFVHIDDRSEAWESIKAVLDGRSVEHKLTYRMLTKQGDYKWVLDRARVIERDAEGMPIRMTGTHTDVHQLKITELALQESERRFRGIFENAGVGIAQVAADGTFQLINDTFCRITGYSRDELLNIKQSFQAITCPDDLDRDISLFKQLIDGLLASYNLEKRYICKDGSTAWVHLSVSAHLDENQQPTSISAVQDITQLKQLQAELEYQAHTDYLTGIANRRYFMELADRELARLQRYEQPLALIMVDIDHFKKVNDQYGHRSGDRVLQHIAHLLKQGLRDLDIIARIGGEEFAVLLPQTNATLALEVAERLQSLVRASEVHLDSTVSLNITVSMGIAVLTEACQDVEPLIHKADTGLYLAKANGRNRIEMIN